ncbi:armadillo-type protein [Mycena crocata]|nr:armadillo-type protein [Mycena crocata]
MKKIGFSTECKPAGGCIAHGGEGRPEAGGGRHLFGEGADPRLQVGQGGAEAGHSGHHTDAHHPTKNARSRWYRAWNGVNNFGHPHVRADCPLERAPIDVDDGCRHDPITANTIFRTSTASTLIQIFDAAQSEELATLAVWCLTRICRSAEVASGLLKENLAKLLVTKGLLNGPPRTARMSAWCIGALIRSDAIADSLADMGLVATLCEHLRRCTASTDASPEDYSAALYPVARISRSIKISKALAKGGCVEMLANLLMTAEHPQVLMWSARTVGCLMRPNSSDMAKMLLDAGIARGLARLPSMLPTEEVEPLGAFAFAIQRFSCAEWGGGVRKSLVEAGVVDALLAAMRTASDEPYPQVHIELAYAISLLGDVGGTSIRKEIVNAGGIEILKRVGASAARTDVTKACNLAATSVTGNVWSRNAGSSALIHWTSESRIKILTLASAKAALAHEWSGGCPDHVPECPVPLKELQSSTESRR